MARPMHIIKPSIIHKGAEDKDDYPLTTCYTNSSCGWGRKDFLYENIQSDQRVINLTDYDIRPVNRRLTDGDRVL